MADKERRRLPWGRILKWGGIYLVVAVGAATALFVAGILPEGASDPLGKALGAGLVAVVLAVIAADRRKG